MTRMVLFRSFVFLSLIAVIVCTPVASCKKKTECSATITVTDAVTGAAIYGAKVRLWANVTNATIEDIQYTDGSGKSYHKFKLQAILDIEVTSGSKKGTGIVKLEPGKNVEQSVRIQ